MNLAVGFNLRLRVIYYDCRVATIGAPREAWTFHLTRSPCGSVPIPMRKLSTGEPCAGKPLARFGGRGGREPFPTPINLRLKSSRSFSRRYATMKISRFNRGLKPTAKFITPLRGIDRSGSSLAGSCLSATIVIMKTKTPAPLPSSLYRATQVRELDRRAIQEFWIPGTTLMARAGKAAFRTLRQHWPKAHRLTVVCGVGNNAGDGYVVARLARGAGLKVKVFQVGDAARLHGDALEVHKALLAVGIQPAPFAPGCLEGAELVVDALLGTGLTGEVRSPFREAIAEINGCGVPVLAVDIPSGLCSDTGRPLGGAVRATVTVTFIGLKLGLFTGEGATYCGQVVFSDLDVPPEVYLPVAPSAQCLDLRDLPRWLPPRPRTAHKGDFGHVLVIGGAPGYAGAGRLAAEAAARTGAGLVSLATHSSHAAQIGATRPEVMVHAVADRDDLAPLLARATVLVLGPGLSHSSWALPLWEAALAADLPMVVDADALNLLAERVALGEGPSLREDWLFTPHPGEAGRLLGCPAAEVQADRCAALESLVQRYGGIWVLKGAGTLIGNAGSVPGLCPVANPGMASGGMGDVLAGLLGGLLAQRVPAPEAARLGVCIHAEAARRAAINGERGMLASEVIPYLRTLVSLP
ncbi:ADP-dependent NAD(P)H-hydrate dehydratase / NAD(P)H-hydrate epimerase [Gammaproteobacteria bacterium]